MPKTAPVLVIQPIFMNVQQCYYPFFIAENYKEVATLGEMATGRLIGVCQKLA